MNGLFNMNFMMTFLLAKDLPETKNKLLMALSAGQSANLMAPVLLKVGAIDTITELTQENTNLKAQVAGLQTALQECEDRSGLTEIRAELEARTLELADCKAKLEGCQKELDGCKSVSSSITASLSKVRAKKNVQELKDDDSLLGEIFKLAGHLSAAK